MAYDRAKALTKLQFSFDQTMTALDKETLDTPNGYASILDSAFGRYGASEVDPKDFDLFDTLLSYYAVVVLQPAICLWADSQLDAPLTKVQGSQICRQYTQMLTRLSAKVDAVYDEAEVYAGGYVFTAGYASGSDCGGFCYDEGM